jgi:TIR domain/Interferon-induced transmembrane protein
VKLFFSYARPDRERADFLAQRLRQAGNEVWLDTELTGGQVWWDKILDQVRSCDALVMMVSWASIKSQACMHERHYATQLGKAVLPVAVERIRAEVLPTDIGRLQVIDYSQPSEAAAFQLVGSVMRLPPPPPLPDPLPEPPSIPISYLSAIADRLGRPDLSRDDQFAIVGILEEALGSADQSDRASARQLIAEMEGRTDLLAAVDKRIAALKDLRRTTGTSPSPGNAGSAGSPGSAAGTASAPGAGTGFRWDRPKPETPAGAQDRGSKSSPSEAAPPKREWQPSANKQWQPSAQKPQPPPSAQQWQPSAQKSQPPPSAQQWQPPPPPPPHTAPSPQPPVVPVSQVIVAISPHWAMAVWSVFFCWPVGIFAVISAARVKPSVASGDLAAAQKASSRVKVLFWISLILLIIIIVAASAASTNNQQ